MKRAVTSVAGKSQRSDEFLHYEFGLISIPRIILLKKIIRMTKLVS